MYVNYEDKDFFEHGRLVNAEYKDIVYDILCCNPYPDEPDLFQFGHCRVDITDTWSGQKVVMGFIGMTEETYDSFQFALGCLDYYSLDNFRSADYGCSCDWQKMDRIAICGILKSYLIAYDNLEFQDSADAISA